MMSHIAQVNGIEINYIDEGDKAAPAVLLLHGFASNLIVNWVATQWVTKLTKAGFRVIALDHRGHGKSTKLYDPKEYEASQMADDAWKLLDYLQIESPVIIGYSMGARVTAFMGILRPNQAKALVLSGLAGNIVHGVPGASEISKALLADSIENIPVGGGKNFRIFAERTHSDLKALAMCIQTSRIKIKGEALKQHIQIPVLIALGDKDDIAGSPEELQHFIPHAKILRIEDKDHMTAVGARKHHEGVISFLTDL